jgi:hypothetical protein
VLGARRLLSASKGSFFKSDEVARGAGDGGSRRGRGAAAAEGRDNKVVHVPETCALPLNYTPAGNLEKCLFKSVPRNVWANPVYANPFSTQVFFTSSSGHISIVDMGPVITWVGDGRRVLGASGRGGRE